MADRKCQVCRSASVVIHNVPHLGVFTALCTACLLRHNPGSFCPVCFEVYDEANNPAAHSCIMCLRCPAVAHLTCLPSAARSSAAFRYLCPHCSDPSFSFICSTAADGASAAGLSRAYAKQYLCAAKIAATVTRRAAAVARADADQKMMGALAARRNAREAIERADSMTNRRDRDHSER